VPKVGKFTGEPEPGNPGANAGFLTRGSTIHAVEPLTTACALCGKDVGGAEPAHVVHDKVVCEACRRVVSALQPRRVLPYADQSVRRRRWVWPTVAAGALLALLFIVMLFVTAQRAAQRARAEEMRALAAEAQARAAAEVAAALARPAQTQPAK